MLSASSFALSVALAVAVPAPAEPPAPPKGPPPSFVFVERIDERANTLTLQVRQFVPQVREVTVTVNRGGVPVIEKQRVNEMVAVTVSRQHTLDSFRVLNAQGKELSTEEGRKRLRSGGTVLLAAEPRPLDPAYLKLLAKDALILVPKEAKPPIPAPGK